MTWQLLTKCIVCGKRQTKVLCSPECNKEQRRREKEYRDWQKEQKAWSEVPNDAPCNPTDPDSNGGWANSVRANEEHEK